MHSIRAQKNKAPVSREIGAFAMCFLCEFEQDIGNAVHAAEVVVLDELVAPVVEAEADQMLFFRAERELCSLAGLQGF